MRTFKSYGLRQYKNCFVYSCKLNGAKNRKCEMNEKLKTTRTPVICGWQFGVPIAEKRHFSFSCIFFLKRKTNCRTPLIGVWTVCGELKMRFMIFVKGYGVTINKIMSLK